MDRVRLLHRMEDGVRGLQRWPATGANRQLSELAPWPSFLSISFLSSSTWNSSKCARGVPGDLNAGNRWYVAGSSPHTIKKENSHACNQAHAHSRAQIAARETASEPPAA